jgi:uncharacterized protein (TIGR03435 family)
MRGIVAGLLLANLLVIGALSQDAATPPPAFEAASLKPSDPGHPPGWPDHMQYKWREPGRVVFSHSQVKVLLQIAFKMSPYQVTCPSWMSEDKYDLIGTMLAATSDDQAREMLKALLVERFQLKLHVEHRAQAIFALIIDKGGPKLTASPDDGIPTVGASHATHQTMHNLAAVLTVYMADRPVIDLTGIEGEYDLDFGPDYVPALKKVGLTLEKRPGTVDYLIIDGASRKPLPN